MTSRFHQQGFTLLEVLVVLMILLTGLTALTQLVRSAMDQSIEAEEKTSVQLECQNRMHQILTGLVSPTVNTPEPIPGFDDWMMTTSLENGPISRLVCIRITAQKYEQLREPSVEQPGVFRSVNRPLGGQRLVLTRWARRDTLAIGKRANASAGSTVIGSLSGNTVQPAVEFPNSSFVPDNTPDPFMEGGFPPSAAEERAAAGSSSVPPPSNEPQGDPLTQRLLERAAARAGGEE